MTKTKTALAGILLPLHALLALLVLAAALLFVRHVLTVGWETRATPVRLGPAPAAGGKEKPVEAYGILLERNPFGFAAGILIPLSAAPASEAASGGELRLYGTITGSRIGFAVFADKENRQQLFRIGEDVFGAGRLARVEPYRAFLEAAGGARREIPMAETVVAPPPPAPGTLGDFARRVGRNEFVVDQRAIQHALDNPNQIMTDARLLPHFQNDRQEGFVVREIRRSGIYDSLGLQNGDVLLQVNDLNISSAETALQAFTALRGMDRIKLDILRGGSPLTLTYQIR